MNRFQVWWWDRDWVVIGYLNLVTAMLCFVVGVFPWVNVALTMISIACWFYAPKDKERDPA